MTTNMATASGAKIILVRHGQSLANAGGMCGDHTTNPLTELGREQARAFAESFRGSPTRFIRSHYLRARQTAEPLLAKFPAVPVEDWPVHEFSYLALTCPVTDELLMPRAMVFWQRADPAHIDGSDVESFTAFLTRVRGAANRLAAMPAGEHIVVFTHGFWMQAFRMHLLFPQATDAELMRSFRRFHNGHFIANTEALEFEARNGRIHMLGQEHLTNFSLEGEPTHA